MQYESCHKIVEMHAKLNFADDDRHVYTCQFSNISVHVNAHVKLSKAERHIATINEVIFLDALNCVISEAKLASGDKSLS